jgi:predicted N-acetyltransferase YhbS
VLDTWLQRRALANQVTRASRSFVVTPEGSPEVVGYYALAAGSVAHAEAVRDLRRNMPDPVPVTILARLAVHRDWQRQRLGSFLLRDAILRTLQAAEIVGSAALLVHAIDAGAEAFYRRHGFQPSRLDPMTLMLPIKAILAAARGE